MADSCHDGSQEEVRDVFQAVNMRCFCSLILDSGSPSVLFTMIDAVRSLACEQHLGEGCSGEASHDSQGLGRFVL